ncbi:MAG: pfkA1 [Firmicutes bacterium]|nr:pfkA1 [Bacillota bacterium]
MRDHHVAGILDRGGTILGTTNRDNPFHFCVTENGQKLFVDKSLQAMKNLKDREIEALVVIGGDGTIKVANDLIPLGATVVAVPKTIDNDIPGTERTFGFDTAVHVATEALDRLRTTAESHHRVMILEVMGRYAGWIALHSGIAGGADGILIPEIPYQLDAVVHKIKKRIRQGKLFSLLVVAEGAKPVGGEVTVARIVENSFEKIRLGGVGVKIAQQIEDITGIESRCTILGHVQRGGTPTSYDRVLATRYGVAAVNALINGCTADMVALQRNEIITVPINVVANKPSNIALDNKLLQAAALTGVCLGQ